MPVEKINPLVQAWEEAATHPVRYYQGKKEAEGLFTAPFQILFNQDGLPVEIRLEENPFKVKSVLEVAEANWSILKPFFDFVRYEISHDIYRLSKRAGKIERQLSLEKVNGHVKPNSRELNEKIWQAACDEGNSEARRYFTDIIAKRIPISRYEISCPDNDFKVTAYRIGQVEGGPEDQWLTATEVFRTAIILNRYLNLKLPPELIALEPLDYEGDRSAPTRLSPRLINITDLCGLTDSETTLLTMTVAHHRKDNQDQPFIGIPLFFHRYTTRHETAHLLDPFIELAELPQSEGFATFVGMGFNFDACSDFCQNIYNGSSCTEEIGLEKIKLILGKNPSRISSWESHRFTSTLFAFIHEKLGIEKVMEFYGLISGGLKYNRNKDKDGPKYLIKEAGNSRQLANDARGNLVRTMEIIGADIDDFSATSFIKEYLVRINAALIPNFTAE